MMKGWALNWEKAFLAAFPVIVVAAIGGAVTAPALDTWYAGLNKPSFNPPDFVFGPAWTVLYVLMAAAVYRLSRDGTQSGDRVAIQFYSIQLVLNLFWSIVFFGLRQPQLALIIIAVLFLFLVLTVVTFLTRDRLAGYLLVPYLLWVLFATALNIGIVLLN